MLTRRTALSGLAAAPLLPRRARAQAAPVMRIGIFQDASGTYSHLGGWQVPTGQDLTQPRHRLDPRMVGSICSTWRLAG